MLYSAMPQTSPHNPITSKENAIVKRLRSLQEHKYRKKEQAFLVEGVKMAEEAIRDNFSVELMVATPSLLQHHGKGVLKLAESRRVEIVWVSDKVMDALSESKTPQPVMAVARMTGRTREDLLSHPSKLILVAHQLQDPGNLGTIIRTAEAVRASGIAISPKTVDPYHAKAIRASMGSILRLPVVQLADTAGFIAECKQAGFQTIGAVLTGKKTHTEVDLKKPTALIFGQEGSGLPPDIMANVDVEICIPMAETIDSLNVAVSAAVILYEAMRQRTGA